MRLIGNGCEETVDPQSAWTTVLACFMPLYARMMRKYADRPMDLADASLVWLANQNGITDIITIDRADFTVYRTTKRKAFRNVFALPG